MITHCACERCKNQLRDTYERWWWRIREVWRSKRAECETQVAMCRVRVWNRMTLQRAREKKTLAKGNKNEKSSSSRWKWFRLCRASLIFAAHASFTRVSCFRCFLRLCIHCVCFVFIPTRFLYFSIRFMLMYSYTQCCHSHSNLFLLLVDFFRGFV